MDCKGVKKRGGFLVNFPLFAAGNYKDTSTIVLVRLLISMVLISMNNFLLRGGLNADPDPDGY